MKNQFSMESFLERITELNFLYPNQIKVYKPVLNENIIMLNRYMPLELLPELASLYRTSDGLSILDYCFVGCTNKKIINIEDCCEGLWTQYPNLRTKFFPLIITSSGEYFGYSIYNNNRSCIGYLSANKSSEILSITSSFLQFLLPFIEEIRITLEKSESKDEYYISRINWPVSLDFWFEKDQEIKRRYLSGEIKPPSWLNSALLRS